MIAKRGEEEGKAVLSREFVFGLEVLFLSCSDTDCTEAADLRTNRSEFRAAESRAAPRERRARNVRGYSNSGLSKQATLHSRLSRINSLLSKAAESKRSDSDTRRPFDTVNCDPPEPELHRNRQIRVRRNVVRARSDRDGPATTLLCWSSDGVMWLLQGTRVNKAVK